MMFVKFIKKNTNYLKTNNMKKLLLLSVAGVVLLTGCAVKEPTTEKTYQTITPEDAKKIMDHDDTAVILDVRTQEEYDEGHIEGAILIPDYEITEKAEELLTDKDTTILVYCRSGRRSAAASAALFKLGYTNVNDFGGIIDWTYDVVTE